MANTDPIEWRLLDTDLVTQKCILPVSQGHIYFELNEPGSGEIRIPLDSTAAGLVSNGMFCMAYYRGSARGGFFVDNLKQVITDSEEGAGRWLSVSGRGPMALLEDVIVYPTEGSNETTRDFTAQHKGDILSDLIQEGFDRGWGTAFDWDFGNGYDSNSAAWTDSDSITFNVGQTLLDVVRDLASTGEIEFGMEYVLFNGHYYWRLHAVQTPIGSNLSSTVFLRIGTNCEEVNYDERGDQIKNALLVKYQNGYTLATDSTSISARRRREKLMSLEAAQSGDSALTFASAKLTDLKNPQTAYAVRVFDGVKPYLFVDYNLGDTITLDKFGTQITDRVVGIQTDFTGDNPAAVVLELGTILYDKDLQNNRDLNWLLNQWNTAKDSNLTEVKQWMSIGQPNGEVRALHNYGDYLYVGGAFTAIGSLVTASYVARYNTVTGIWEAMSTDITATVTAITDVAGTLYACTTDKVYSWGGSSWTLVGTVSLISTGIVAAVSDGTYLYIGGGFNPGAATIGGVTIKTNVASYNGSIWASVGSSTITGGVLCMTIWNSLLYIGKSSPGTGMTSYLQHWSGSAWVDDASQTLYDVQTLQSASDTLLYFISNNVLRSWTGSGSVTDISTFSNFVTGGSTKFNLALFLTDLFVGGGYNTIDGVSGFGSIGKYSGGNWLMLGSGIDQTAGDAVRTMCVIGDDLYAGGLFSTVDSMPISNLAVWITSFPSLVNHLSHDNSFDMAQAIHQATASAITDNDEMGFWEDVSKALRKITWANIKATLKTYFDTLYSSYLYLSNRPTAETNTNDIFSVGSTSTSAFSGTINGTPSGTSVVYNAGFSGSDKNLVPTSTSQLAKLILYNTTRGDSALISNSVVATKTITLTATVPASWANGDTITIASQTVSGGTGNWVDLKFTSGPTGKSYIFMQLQHADSDTVTATNRLRTHPFETFGTSKLFALVQQTTTQVISVMILQKIISDTFTVSWISTGTNTVTLSIREMGYLE